MKINFVYDQTNGYEEWFALSELAIYRGKAYDELIWAEIRQIGDKQFRVMWEDDHLHPEIVNGTLEDAKRLVLSDYTKHAPHKNGPSFNIEEL